MALKHHLPRKTASSDSRMSTQLTGRALVVGLVGCVVITTSSAYTALRLGALPWPIIFAALVSLFFLRLLGSTSLNEANITHTIMSSGAMVAGGLAFTIPGAWMLGLADQMSLLQIGVVAFAGCVLGLLATALIHQHFIVDNPLEFPTGAAAAQTLTATQSGGSVGKNLALSMGAAGLWTLLRDSLHLMPVIIGALPVPGMAFGLYNSPMMASMGYLVGGIPVVFWAAGALLAALAAVLAPVFDFLPTEAATFTQSLGMGLMMGAGIAVVVKDILPSLIKSFANPRSSRQDAQATQTGAQRADKNNKVEKSRVQAQKTSLISGSLRWDAGLIGLAAALVALLLVLVLQLSPVVAVVVVLMSFVTSAMAAQATGQTGLDPMEIFGLIVMLLIAAFAQLTQVQLFFIAGVIAVGCGLAGDVMNDFKAGALMGTNPRAQWLGQAVGALVGCIIATATIALLLKAYGPDAFGPGKQFVAAQASVVATMVSGIPHVGAFVIGVVAGLVLYWVKLPAMLFGLGIYLPFYLSATACLGAVVRLCVERYARRKATNTSAEIDQVLLDEYEERGLLMASGVLGGESIVGVLIALVALLSSM